MGHIGKFSAVIMVLLLSACSERTLRQAEINEALYTGNPQKAYSILTTNEKRWEKKRNLLLYYWERANVAWMMGKTDESIDYFMKSDYLIEDAYRNYAVIALSLFTNDKVRDYLGEDHERILFHYYQILNFLQDGNMEYALVQTRRLQLELNRLDDKYRDKKDKNTRRYQRDAFAYVVMAIVYEAANETNNAWIACKKAVEIYEQDYKPEYGLDVPEQLKSDALRLAAEMGFTADREFLEKKFGRKYNPATDKGGNLVFFWNSGLSPVKEEVAVNFQILRGGSPGWVTFYNQDFGFSIPVFVGEDKTQDGSYFSRVEFVRATFPRYFSRGMMFGQAVLKAEGMTKPLEPAEDVDQIARKVLGDRFLEEIGKTLLRLALKKATEYELREKNPDAGAALGIVNFFTEQADTRSWETLPATIFYARMQLPAGSRQVQLETTGNQVNQTSNFTFTIPTEGLLVHGFHTLQPSNTGRTR